MMTVLSTHVPSLEILGMECFHEYDEPSKQETYWNLTKTKDSYLCNYEDLRCVRGQPHRVYKVSNLRHHRGEDSDIFPGEKH